MLKRLGSSIRGLASKMTAISIIVPVYNSEKYLQETITSLRNQSFTDIEMIFINDGSSDGSLGILETNQKEDPRVKVFSQENSGPAKARNVGLSNAAGRYLMFCDSDDTYEPTMCEEMLRCIESECVDLVVCDSNVVDMNCERPIDSIDYIKLPYIGYGLFGVKSRCATNSLLWNKIFKVSIVRKYKITFPSGFEADDMAFIQKYCAVSTNYYGLNRKLYNYSVRNGSIMDLVWKGHRKKDKELDPMYACINFFDFLKANNLLDSCTDLYVERLKMESVYCFRTLVLTSTKEFFALLDRHLQDIDLSKANASWFLPEVKNHNYKNAEKILRKYKTVLTFDKIFTVIKTGNKKIFYLLGFEIFKKKKEKYREKFYLFKQKIFSKKLNCSLTLKDLQGQISEFRGRMDYYERRRFSVCDPLNVLINMNISNRQKLPCNNLIFFDCLYDKQAECIDAFSLYKKAKECYHDRKCWYIVLQDSVFFDKIHNDPNVIAVANEFDFIINHLDLISESSHAFTSFGFWNENYKKLFKLLPFCTYVFIDHGCILLKEWVVTDLYNKKFYDKVLVPTRLTMDLYLSNQYWNQEDMIFAGLPRWYDLNTLQLSNDAEQKCSARIFVFFTWRKCFEKNKFAINSYANKIIEFLSALANLHLDCKIAVALHHAMLLNSKDCKDFFIPNHSNIELVQPTDISTYVRGCSMLITDFSSLCFDFMYQNKPVVFYTLNDNSLIIDWYDKSTKEKLISVKDKMYNVCETQNDAIKMVKHYSDTNFRLEARNIEVNNKIFWDHCDSRKEILKKTLEL